MYYLPLSIALWSESIQSCTSSNCSLQTPPTATDISPISITSFRSRSIQMRYSLHFLPRLPVRPSNLFALWKALVFVGYSRRSCTIQFHSFPDYFMSLPAAIPDEPDIYENTKILSAIPVSLDSFFTLRDRSR